MKDRITRIDLIPLKIKLKKPFVISLGSVEYAENLVVRMLTRDGLTGYGECCPFRWINGESLETALVVGGYLKEVLQGRYPLDIEGCVELMDRVIYGNRSVKSAFDIALHDISAQAAGLPLYQFLGGTVPKHLLTDYTVSLGHPDEMASEAASIVSRGFAAVKVKVGGDTEEDLRRISEIRRVIPPQIPLRLDANQGWSRESAAEVLSQLADMNIEFCEEPIPRWDFMSLHTVRERSAVPVMVDESCSDHHDLERLVSLKACDYANIKLGKSGGLLTATKMLRFAERKGIRVQVGGFVESRLGFTASAHLALASPNVEWCDFDTPLMLEEDPVQGGITYLAGGVVEIPNGTGLGARLNLT